MCYAWERAVVAQRALKLIICLVSPPEGAAVSPFRIFHIKVPPASIAHVVREFVRCPLLERSRVSVIYGFPELHPTLLGCPELQERMDAILAEQPPIMVANVGVSASSIRSVVGHFALGRHRCILPHDKII